MTPSPPQGPWLVCADTGGTFTDVLARPDADAPWRRIKVFSTGVWRTRVLWFGEAFRIDGAAATNANLEGWRCRDRVVASAGEAGLWRLSSPLPSQPGYLDFSTGEEAPVIGWRLISGTAAQATPPPCEFRVATTRATNALLENKAAPVALFLTAGFGDLLRIGTQQRSDLFRLAEAEPSYQDHRIIQVPGRLDATGREVASLAQDGPWVAEACRAREDGYREAAVCLMHSHRNGEHERAVRSVLLRMGFQRVTLSSELSPVARYLVRSQTTLVHSALVPVMASYLGSLARSLPGSRVRVMTSAGTLVEAAQFPAKDSLLSGPAGGLNAARALGLATGTLPLVTFDMGGTSTDVARVTQEFQRVSEIQLGSVRLQSPALAVESVAAGGGSICRCGPEGFAVGPESAGSLPGPACFGNGGPLTVTDINLLLGRIQPGLFSFQPDREEAERRLSELAAEGKRRGFGSGSPEEAAIRLLECANETMASALRSVTLRNGHDPSTHRLVAYGGAGGLHACELAARLGMREVLLPAQAGLFSAEGLCHALGERVLQGSCPPTPLAASQGVIEATVGNLLRTAPAEDQAAPVRRIELMVRKRGHDFSLAIDSASPEAVATAFAREYRRHFGLEVELDSLEVAAVRLSLSECPHPQALQLGKVEVSRKAPSADRVRCWTSTGWEDVSVWNRAELRPGDGMNGPGIVQDPTSSLWIPPGWRAVVGRDGTLHATGSRLGTGTDTTPPDEILLNRLTVLAKDMGHRLAATAVSVNIRERLDFSCAFVDARGELAVHAPHVPVHLGSLGVCVRALCARLGSSPGSILLTNHPAYGGSHLPDITVAAPVHADSGELLGWVVNRAHHAEIGGRVPGSLPIDARRLDEEGVVFPPMKLAAEGVTDLSAFEALLNSGPWPSRRPEENLADLRAQIASLRLGVERLRQLGSETGPQTFLAFVERLQERGARTLREALAKRGPFLLRQTDCMDDGTPLVVRLESDGNRLTVDFSGTGGVHPGNLNATAAIVRSALLYCLRVWLGGDLPLCEGVLRPVDLVLPAPSLLNPTFADAPSACPAVMGGNVETSQRVVDLLLAALGLCAQSQGTMNNLVFGTATTSFYETIGGGGGATADFPGRSGRHVHMTNTAIADPEILEERHPVRLRQFALRRNSGGAGLKRGGDGLIREIEFLEPHTVSLLTQRRVVAPKGAEGGGDGLAGRQSRGSADGGTEWLPHAFSYPAAVGDWLRLETPGGGGWGSAASQSGR